MKDATFPDEKSSAKTTNSRNKKVKNGVFGDCASPGDGADSSAINKRKGKSRKSQKPNEHPSNGKLDTEKENSTLSSKSPEKVNAFQFMMNSRHKSIGRNSPGKEIDLNNSLESVLVRQDVKARRSRLKSWAEAKGALKRKREYEEVGKCIEHKLQKRRKKLKRLLNVDCQSDDEVITSRRKRNAVIKTDSEDSNDFTDANPRSTGNTKLLNGITKGWRLKIKNKMDENCRLEGQEIDENESKTNKPLTNQSSSALGTTEPTTIEDNNEPKTKKQNDEPMKECESEVISPNKLKISSDRVLRSRHTKPKVYEDYLMSDSEEELSNKNRRKSKLKMAPVFLKAAPKQKLDPEIAEARRQFLLSGIPSSLKKEMNKQTSVDEVDFDIFPSISHVQQKTNDNRFWDLPKIELELAKDDLESIQLKGFDRNLLNLESKCLDRTIAKKVRNSKEIIRQIKSQNPDYPVYKIFKSLNEQSGYDGLKPEKKQEKASPKRRNRKQKKIAPIEVKSEENSAVFMQWTEKYRAESSGEIIGNKGSVTSLKEWLTAWVNLEDGGKIISDSESEFDTADGTKSHGNTVILRGPTGCGKTAAVYTVCQELGLNVLEVNASSKRTGRWLLQELQEATQSHQVRKKEFFETEKRDKMCVLLVEDIDVVFEQDEGFSAALCQIIGTSKRPIVLTTTDDPSPSVQKVVGDFRVIKFAALSSILTVWLQIVCLVEGYYVDKTSIDELLSFNKGDIRRTLLQLQFWVSSGCQLHRNVPKIEPKSFVHTEDNSNLSDLRVDLHSDASDVEIQYNCISLEQSDGWPHCSDLETIYWNIPNMFGVTKTENSHDPKREKSKMIELCKFYDSLAFADTICDKKRFCESLERRWRRGPKNSLALEENMSGYDDDTPDELARRLLSGRVKIYRETFETGGARVDVAAASRRRWSKQFADQERLLDAVPVSETLSRRAVALDYLPALRNVARSEAERAANNTKRGNRFYNYLTSLGVRSVNSSFIGFRHA